MWAKTDPNYSYSLYHTQKGVGFTAYFIEMTSAVAVAQRGGSHHLEARGGTGHPQPGLDTTKPPFC